MFEKSAGRQFDFLTQMQLQTVKIVQTDALSQCFVDFLPVLRCFSGTNLNLYHYAGNNRVKYVDPDGRGNRTSQNLRKDYLKTQKMLIGAKYVYGAENPLNLEKDKNGRMKEGGVDCSGAPQFGLRLMGYLIPERVNANQFVENYTEQVELSTCEPGDLRAMRMDDNYVYHLQTVTENGRINPTGDSSNTYDNPGEVEEFIGELPSSGTIQRLSADLLSQYYNSSADIVGGKLNPSQLDKAWENICKWSN